jgi:mRNA interferase YafQ
MYDVVTTKSFRKSFKRLIKNKNFNQEEFEFILDLLKNDKDIPVKYRDHALSGDYKGFRDIHIQPDVVLLYIKIQKILVLELVNIGSHSELF